MAWKKGESGNPAGRTKSTERLILDEALKKAQKKRGMHLIEAVVIKAYDDPVLAGIVFKKILPDQIKNEVDISDMRIMIVRNPPKDDETKKPEGAE